MCRLIAFLIASHAAVALACSCAPGLHLVSPGEGQKAPPNARVFLGDGWALFGLPEETTPQLFNQLGVRVPTRLSSIETGLGRLDVLTPEAPLEEGFTYEAKVGDTRLTRFEVSGPALTTAPPVPRVVERSGSTYYGSGGGDCGDSFWATWELSAAGALVLVDRDGTTTFDPQTLTGNVASANHVAEQGLTSSGLGNGGCGGNWEEAGPGADVRARFGVLDAAGNFSGWSALDRGEVPLLGCSCGGEGSALLLACLGLLVRARRRV